LLQPYQAFATGAGLDKDGYFLAIVLVNPDEDTAANNVSLLEKRIKEIAKGVRGADSYDKDAMAAVSLAKQ